MKINVRRIKKGSNVVNMPKQIEKGDWIDLSTREKTSLYAGQYARIPLGIAMELPRGFEAIVAPRSSTYEKWSVTLVNSLGVIDNRFNSDTDEWQFLAKADSAVEIPAGTRICQFRIQPSQFATPWQKIKWLFTSRITFVEVATLGNSPRGGIGSTGD